MEPIDEGMDFNDDTFKIDHRVPPLPLPQPSMNSFSFTVSSPPSKKYAQNSNTPPSLSACTAVQQTEDCKNDQQTMINTSKNSIDSNTSTESFEDAEEGDENDTAFLPSAMKQQLYASIQHHQSIETPDSLPLKSKLDFSTFHLNSSMEDSAILKVEENDKATELQPTSYGTALHRSTNTHEDTLRSESDECTIVLQSMQLGCTEKDADLTSEDDELRSRNECKIASVESKVHKLQQSYSSLENFSTDNVCLNATELEIRSNCQIMPEHQMLSNSATRDDSTDMTMKDLPYRAHEDTSCTQQIHSENVNDHGEVNYATCEDSKNLAAHSSPDGNNRQPSLIPQHFKITELETHSNCRIAPEHQMLSNSATRDDSTDMTMKDLPYRAHEDTSCTQQIHSENVNDHGEVNYATCEDSKNLAAHSSPDGNNQQPSLIPQHFKTVCGDESVNGALDVSTALADAEEKVTQLIMERDAISSLYKQMNAQNLQEMQSLRKYFEDKISEQQIIMEQQCVERESQAKQTAEKNLSAEYSLQVAMLQEQLLAEIEGHKAQLKQLDDEHRSEIDELIQQLDDVELEQESKYKDLQQRMNEKETIISVLSSQLVEANAAARKMDQKRIMDEEQTSAVREELSLCRQEVLSLQKKIETIKAEHAEDMENEAVKRRKAIQLVTEDVKAAAEAQFAEANKHYIRLKHEYDGAKLELKKLRDVHDNFVKDSKAHEVSMLAIITKLKAELASAEARVAEVTQQYSVELENIRLADRALRAELEETKKNSALAHSSLAHMARENEELRKISEELMAMVEGNQSA